MNKHFTSSVLAFIFLLMMSSTGCAHYSRGPWSGRVIDAATKQPIEGAGVFVMWRESYAVPPGGGDKVEGAMETLTDKDGYFKIPSKSLFAMLPGGEIYGPLIKIFKPGYKYFEHNEYGETYRKPGETDYSGEHDLVHYYPKDWKGLFEKPDAVVELTKLKTRKERLKNLGDIESAMDVFCKFKLYMNLINKESKDLGLEPY